MIYLREADTQASERSRKDQIIGFFCLPPQTYRKWNMGDWGLIMSKKKTGRLRALYLIDDSDWDLMENARMIDIPTLLIDNK